MFNAKNLTGAGNLAAVHVQDKGDGFLRLWLVTRIEENAVLADVAHNSSMGFGPVMSGNRNREDYLGTGAASLIDVGSKHDSIGSLNLTPNAQISQ